MEAGNLLVCQAGNPRIPDSTLEDAWKLEIHCKYKGNCNFQKERGHEIGKKNLLTKKVISLPEIPNVKKCVDLTLN